MTINFNEKELQRIDNFKNGDKFINVSMEFDGLNRIMHGFLEPGASIGMHTHETSSEIIYILKGKATIICDGKKEIVEKGMCHYCKKGSSHTFINNFDDIVEIFAVVPEQ